ncbi:hypothetical protein AVEN_21911-1 [Araneus ventricosus]|uniref:Uncharacterized protein n=1 Tax=Araneus ventricosus TaxID=182803 RepID=A0A4Y2D1N1_ARAVE|nr:hypothetical protein AVEN_21911-1 [Araneus ventricosus]
MERTFPALTTEGCLVSKVRFKGTARRSCFIRPILERVNSEDRPSWQEILGKPQQTDLGSLGLPHYGMVFYIVGSDWRVLVSIILRKAEFKKFCSIQRKWRSFRSYENFGKTEAILLG